MRSASLIGSSLLTPDPLTLQIILARPSGGFLAALTYPPAYAVPRQLVEKYGNDWTAHLTENGGFGGNLCRMTRLDGEGHITLTRNEIFWDAKPKLREIEFQLYDSAQAAWVGYLKGAGDVVYPPDGLPTDALKNSSFHQVPQPNIYYFRPNWKKPPFDDIRVRQAFSLALDRHALVASASQGSAQPTIHLIPEGMTRYNADLRDAARRSGPDTLSADKAKAVELWNAYLDEACPGRAEGCGYVYFMPVYPRLSRKIIDAAVKMWNDRSLASM